MAKKKSEYVVLDVTFTEQYVFKDGEINGWTPEEVVEDWFKAWPLHSHHATRDAYALGGSKKLVKVKVSRL